jgi:autotransporter-associated beta strand protein
MKARKPQFPSGKLWRPINLFLLGAVFCVGRAAAQDGYWINPGGASWASASNWDPADGIAGGADDTAYFGFGREASLSPSASFTLDGVQTIGNICFTTQGGPASWSINPGAGGSLVLDSTFGSPQITVTSPLLRVTLNAIVAGGGGVEKDGAGTLVLAANNTYAGSTLVKGGGLKVSGSVGAGGVEVANATLSGTGVILGPVVVGSGGVLSVGNGSGPLTISNSLVLLPGSTTYVTINGAASGQPLVQGLWSVTYGGTLVVSNLSGALSLGETFSIFGAASVSGSFSSIVPPPGPWLRWRLDPATGQLTVVSSGSQPAFSGVSLEGDNLVVHVSNGPPGSPGYIMASSDLNQPVAAWTQMGSQIFDTAGNFTFTNSLSATDASQMYFTVFVIPSP